VVYHAVLPLSFFRITDPFNSVIPSRTINTCVHNLIVHASVDSSIVVINFLARVCFAVLPIKAHVHYLVSNNTGYRQHFNSKYFYDTTETAVFSRKAIGFPPRPRFLLRRSNFPTESFNTCLIRLFAIFRYITERWTNNESLRFNVIVYRWWLRRVTMNMLMILRRNEMCRKKKITYITLNEPLSRVYSLMVFVREE